MEGLESETLEEARGIAAALKAALPAAVDAIEQGISHKTIFYVLVARESLLHRVCSLSDDVFALIDVDRSLSAATGGIQPQARHRSRLALTLAAGRVLPWLLKVGGEVISHDLSPTLSTNDAQLETEAVLSGHVIGSLSGLSAAPLIRAGRLVPLLANHVSDHMSVHIYYGSRTAQPSRVRAFIDRAVERLVGSSDYVLDAKELALAEANGRRKMRRL
ncbi:LysR substrate-binding domain-containing protein [Pandoraea sp.]|uniref:LysR substrate-binding domain-containing protein n=1 Tax=Pandoraea sp. TaxID=1883445 RepID=UPI0035B494B0